MHKYKTIIVALAASLALAACGGPAEKAEPSTSKVASSSAVASSTSAAPTSSSAPTTVISTSADNAINTEIPSPTFTDNPNIGSSLESLIPTVPAADPAVPPAVPSVANVAPVDGAPAGVADSQAIQGLVNSIIAPTTMRGFLGSIMDNTCRSVLNKQGEMSGFDLNTVPDIPLDSIPEYQSKKPAIKSIQDIRVAGDQASAHVVTVVEGKETEGNMRFLKEDNRWKLCE